MKGRSVVLDGAYGHRNMGDELMLATIQSALDLGPQQLTVLTADPEDTRRRHGVSALAKEHRYLTVTGANRLLQAFRLNLRLLGVFRRAGVYVIGGGSLLTDERGPLPVLRYLTLSTMARLFGCRVYLFGVGIGPIGGRLSRIMVKMLLRLSSGVLVRDEGSAGWVRTLAPGTALTVSHDIVLGSVTAGSPRVPRRRVLGVSLRDIPPSQRDVSRHESRSFLVENVARILDRFLDETGGALRFIPFQELPDSAGGRVDDAALAKAVVGKLKHKENIEIVTCADAGCLSDAIGSCEMLFGERFHSLVLALLNGTPFIMLDYHPKITELLKAVDLQDRRIPLSDLVSHGRLSGPQVDSIVDRLKEVWTRRQQVGEEVARASADLRTRTQQQVQGFAHTITASL